MDKFSSKSRKWTPEQAREFFKKKRSFSENNVIDDDSFDLVEVLNNLKYESSGGELNLEQNKKRGRRNSSPAEFRYEEPQEVVVVEDNEMDICSGNLSAFSLLVDFGQILRTKDTPKDHDSNENEIEIDAENSSPMSPEQPSTPPATTPVVFANQLPMPTQLPVPKFESTVRIIPQMPPLQQPPPQHQHQHQMPQHQHQQIPSLHVPQKPTQYQHQHQVPAPHQQQMRTQQAQVQVQVHHAQQGQQQQVHQQMQLQAQQQGQQGQQQQQGHQVLSPQQQQAKKRKNRRKHTEIQRTFICPLNGCGKAYGSEGACKTHVRIKHQDIFSVQQQTMSLSLMTQFPLTQLN